MKNFIKFFAFLFVLCQSFSLQALIYVNINSPSGGDGSSWATAFNDLEPALSSAVSGDQIWVAQGTYIPSQGYNVLTGSPVSTLNTQTFKIPADIQVYGGFNGTETTLSQRNFKTNLTILSGNLGVGINAYHVVFFFRVGSTGTLLDGFTISDGVANNTSPNNSGGGIYNNGSGSSNISNPSIRNCNLTNNSAINGGAFNNNGGNSGTASPSFENCVFSNNIVTNQGGAVYNNGIAAGNSLPSFVNCLFATNQANNQGGAVYNSGISGDSSPSFTNVTFYNNSASNGAILYATGNGNTEVSNSILWETTTSPSLISLAAGATASISYSDVVGSWPGVGNIDADPLFTDELNLIGPDLIWTTDDDGLTLQPSSPALATGTSTGAPTTDIIGNPQTTPASMGCYTALLPPTVTNINPSNGLISGGTVVVITGTNFTNATAVNFGASAAISFSVDSSTQITAVSPPGSGIVDVTVTTPLGTSAISPNDQFAYIGPFSPTNVEGCSAVVRFATQADYVNIITWDAPAFGPFISAYAIYRDNFPSNLIGVVPSNQELEFEDHNRKRNVTYTYYIASIDQFGNMSAPATIQIKTK